MVIVNQNIIGEQCIRNDDGMLVASDENKKNFEKCIMRSFWAQSVWNKNSSSETDTVSGPHHVINKGM